MQCSDSLAFHIIALFPGFSHGKCFSWKNAQFFHIVKEGMLINGGEQEPEMIRFRSKAAKRLLTMDIIDGNLRMLIQKIIEKFLKGFTGDRTFRLTDDKPLFIAG